MNLFKKKENTISLNSGEEFKWHKGVKLEAIEKSAFIIPGAILQDLSPDNPINNILEISDDETQLMPVSEEKIENSDFAVILNPGVAMKININCVVIHIHLNGEEKRKKQFKIEE